jgi:hypothetical protein
MRVYATMMTYEGQDIVGWVIGHMIRQAVDGIVICDNGSPDRTLEIVEHKTPEAVAADIDYQVFVNLDRAFDMDDKMNALVDRATFYCDLAYGTDKCWILPIEQDEFWGSFRGPLAHVLTHDQKILDRVSEPPPPSRTWSCCEMNGIYLSFDNFVPTLRDSDDPNPLRRMNWKAPHGDPKIPKGRQQPNNQRVMFPADRNWTKRNTIRGAGSGLGSLDRTEARRHPNCVSGADAFYIRHYPVRGPEQAVRKYRGLKEALDMSSQDETYCHHARDIGSWSPGEIRRWYAESYFSLNPEADGLVYDPWRE